MYEDLIIRNELFGLTDKKFNLCLLLCMRIQQLDQGHPKAIDTMTPGLLESVIEEVKADALTCLVVEPDNTEEFLSKGIWTE
ncbi:hypothetical protein ACFL35_01045 [Candidatus Riflebacteria bacterium]